MRLLVVLIAFVVGCKQEGGKSCRDRADALAQRLANPRSIDEIIADGPPELAKDLEAVKAREGGERATAIAERLEELTKDCRPLHGVFANVAAHEGPHGKDQYLRTETPPAFVACECRASPEHAGGLVEAIVGVWTAPR